LNVVFSNAVQAKTVSQGLVSYLDPIRSWSVLEWFG